MRLSNTTKNNSDSVTGSLSYINTLVNDATSEGKYMIVVDGQYLNDSMIEDLSENYGYSVSQRNDFMGTNGSYTIRWGILETRGPVQPPTPTPTPLPATSTPTPTPTPNRVAGVDFTIEWWLKANTFTSPSYFPRPYSLGSFPAPNAVSIENSGNNLYWWTGNGGAKITATSLSLQTNTWYHIAVTRDNGALSLYVDGVRKATATYNDAIPSAGNTLYIGAEPYTGGTKNYVNGKMTNYRWNASVKYTGDTFTVPTSPLTADSNTKFLMLATDSGNLTTDSSTLAKTITNNGATWSSDSPFVSGGGSVNFAGTGYFTVPASSDWDL
jgi:hypothetical protein